MRCCCCENLVEIDDAEPCFRRPDAWMNLSASEWVSGHANNDVCFIGNGSNGGRFFVRAVAPFAVHGRERPLRWGLWVEVDKASAKRVLALWDDNEQHLEPPFSCTVANRIVGYPPTVGLKCELQLQSPKERPTCRLLTDHPLALEQILGVHAHRVQEWLDAMMHGDSEGSS
jgi:hypothetical protein